MRFSPLFVGTALLAGLLACSRDHAPDAGMTARDSAGVRVVENSAPLWTPSTEWRLESTPSVEIEGAPEDEEYYLYVPFDLQRMEDGRIVVPDRGLEQVLVFDSLGGFLNVVGGQGDGPGEFERVWGAFRCVHDTLVVRERSRVSILNSQAGFVRTERVAGRLAKGQGEVAGISADCSSILLFGQQYREPTQGEGVNRPAATLFWAALDGTSRDTVVSFPFFELYPWSVRGYLVNQRLPFGKEPVWVVGGDHVYFGSSEGFEIYVFGRQGDLVQIIRWTAEPQRVTRADWDRFAESQARYLREYPSAAEDTPPPDHFPVPEYKPAYDALLVDDEGNLWVRQYQFEDYFGPEPIEEAWWLFDPTGRWLGTIRTPQGFTVSGVQKDYVMGVIRDENDVAHVRLYGLNKRDRP